MKWTTCYELSGMLGSTYKVQGTLLKVSLNYVFIIYILVWSSANDCTKFAKHYGHAIYLLVLSN